MKAVIFDMNGVVINDERFHQRSWRVLVDRHPTLFRNPTEEEFKHDIFGRPEKATLEYLLRRPITPQELEGFSTERVEIVKALFNPPVLAEGLENLLRDLSTAGVPIGLATSSRPNYVDYILDGLNIRHHFQAIMTAEDILEGKPHPEIYLKAAEALNVAPDQCAVFEDTISGIKAARSAGMYVVALEGTHTRDELTSADEVITSFKQVRLIEGQLANEAQGAPVSKER